MQYLIKSDDWYQISTAGKVISVYCDEQDDGAKNSAQVRVYGSKTKPTNDDFTKAKRVYRPIGNADILQLTPDNEDIIFWAKCLEGGEATVTVETGLVGGVKQLDVAIQDQHSPVVEGFFAEELAGTTVVSGGAVDTRTITVAAGHGFVGFSTAPGECIVFKGYYMGRVLTVSGDTLTVDMPFNISIPAGATVYRSSTNMLVDGSVIPHIFKFECVAGRKFDVRGVRVVFRSSSAMDYTKFGGATALTSPFVFRKKMANDRYNDIAACRHNGELELVFSLKSSDRAPSGEYGMLAEYPASESRGVVFRLDGNKSEELQFVIYADLRTGNTFLRAAAYGHVVEE